MSEAISSESQTSVSAAPKIPDEEALPLIFEYLRLGVLNMQLNRTIVGRDIMKKVEELYADARYEEISEEEREWLMRINLIWKNGCGSGVPRDIV